MYFFTYGQDIAAVEDADQATKYAATDWRAVSIDDFMDAWKRRDARDLARIWAEVVPVVATAPLDARGRGTLIERLPRGWARYNV